MSSDNLSEGVSRTRIINTTKEFESCGLCDGTLENDLERDTGVCIQCSNKGVFL